MISIEDIIWHENNFARAFAQVEERDYGLLFFNRDNPISHDSNHALILNLECDLDAAIADVDGFYRGLGLGPRVNHGFVAGGSEILLPKLITAGFETENFEEYYYEQIEASKIAPVEEIEVRRIRELDAEILDTFWTESPWSKGVIERQLLRADFHFLVGYVAGLPVTMASLDVAKNVSRVDDVVTHPSHRRKGFSRALMHELVKYHRQVSSHALYLYASDPSALKIYHEAGFRKMDWKPQKWTAWLP